VGQYLFTGSETTSAYLTVQSVDEAAGSASCVAANACALEGVQLTVHVGNMRNEAPTLSRGDERAIAEWAAPNAVDFLAVSYCRSARDVEAARACLASSGAGSVRVIAKIENKEGLARYREIAAAADGVIFSRGSMGNCLDPEKMFLAQKMLLAACNMAGKPVYVTRVVDTMTDAPRPTRAEATDVANAVLDGADGIVLGSETFRGKFPVQAVETVGAICRQAERCFDATAYYNHVMDAVGAHTLHPDVFDKTEALATAAVRASTKVAASLIVAFTVTGRTAALIAKYRPANPVLTVCTLREPVTREPAPGAALVPLLSASGLSWAYTPERAARQCLALRGVLPVCVDGSPSAEAASPGGRLDDGDVLRWALEHAVSVGLLKAGDRVVVSQCPHVNPRFADTMAEKGTVKMLLVDEALLAGSGGGGLGGLGGATGMEVGGATVRRVSSRLMGSAEVLA
jgi:pyruvate kinase